MPQNLNSAISILGFDIFVIFMPVVLIFVVPMNGRTYKLILGGQS
jgi:hypothetical protein